MNDKQKKAAVIGGGALAVGYYVLSRKGGSDGGGGMGSILGKAGSGLSLPGSSPTSDTPSNPASTISDILSNLPPMPGYSDTGFGTPSPGAAMASIPQVMHTGGGAPISKKRTFTVPNILPALSIIPKIGVYSIMKPTQLLGGSAAHAENAFVSHFESKSQRRHRIHAQAANVRRYPRTSHAISMLTGGATARAPVTKKQYAARRNHPVIYHAWKSLFGWLGA